MIAHGRMIRRYCPWGNIDEVEHATLQWADMLNHRQLLEPIGIISPDEFAREPIGIISPDEFARAY
jgi:hypothetical protein